MMLRTSTSIVSLILLAVIAGCSATSDHYRSKPVDPEWLHRSVKALTDVMIYDIFNPPQAARAYAYSSIAAYETLVPGEPTFVSLAGQLNGLEPLPRPENLEEVYLPLASIHAFLTVGRALTFSQDRLSDYRDRMHGEFRRFGVPRPVFEQSIAYGQAVADHILAWAGSDYYRETRGYPKFTVTRDDGRWIPTPPAYMDAIEPNWHLIRPLALDSTSQFRPPPPAAFDLTEGSEFLNQVMEVYRAGTDLGKEEREIASFWDCNPYAMHIRGHAMFATKKITPGGHWMGIAAIAARNAGSDLIRSAETYARLSIALADGFKVSWEAKYQTNLVRPETVINSYIDRDWVPLLQTPPFPEYTSGHSVISRAAAEVLTDLYGEPFAYVDTTEVEFGLPAREFDSFREAAAEAAISRLYGGIHYPMAIEVGIEQGRLVGEHVVDRIRTRRAMAGNSP